MIVVRYADDLDGLRRMSEAHPDQPEIHLEYANGLFNASSGYGSGQKWTELGTVLDGLRRMSEAHPDQPEIHLACAKGLRRGALLFSGADREAELLKISKESLGLCDRIACDNPAFPAVLETVGWCLVSLLAGMGRGWQPEPELVSAMLERLVTGLPHLPEGAVRDRIAALLQDLQSPDDGEGGQGPDNP